jgi:hypothetical protein
MASTSTLEGGTRDFACGHPDPVNAAGNGYGPPGIGAGNGEGNPGQVQWADGSPEDGGGGVAWGGDGWGRLAWGGVAWGGGGVPMGMTSTIDLREKGL